MISIIEIDRTRGLFCKNDVCTCVFVYHTYSLIQSSSRNTINMYFGYSGCKPIYLDTAYQILTSSSWMIKYRFKHLSISAPRNIAAIYMENMSSAWSTRLQSFLWCFLVLSKQSLVIMFLNSRILSALWLNSHARPFVTMGLLPDTWNCGLCMRRECREHFPHYRLQRKPLVSDPGMHHGTCLPHLDACRDR